MLSGIIIEGYQTICVGYTFHLQRVDKLYRKYKPVRITQQKEHLLIWNSESTQNLNIYLHNYQTETASYFSSYKASRQAWKNNYGTQLFKFFHTENTSKQQKMVAGFWEELLREFLLLWIYYSSNASAGSSEAKISTRMLLELCQLTKQLIS